MRNIEKLENDLHRLYGETLVDDAQLAEKLYASLCNVVWIKDSVKCMLSFREAARIVAEMRDIGEHELTFYCCRLPQIYVETIAPLVDDGWSFVSDRSLNSVTKLVEFMKHEL